MATVGNRRSVAAAQLCGTLSQLQGNIIAPSTLTYKERTELQRRDAYEYGRIYSTSTLRGMSVYDRLTAEASVRQTMTTMKLSTVASTAPPADSFAAMDRAAAMAAATGAVAGMDKLYHSSPIEARKAATLSGWVSNNKLNLTCKQQQADTASTSEPPLSALHPITLRSYYKGHPVDLLAAGRPQARTAVEITAMFGTYSSDAPLAQALGVLIPNASSSAQLMMK